MTPGVSHDLLEIDWASVLATNATVVQSTYQTALDGLNFTSQSTAGKTTGLNADALDGLDSTAFGQGGGGGTVLSFKCGWVASSNFDSGTWPYPAADFMETKCEDQAGNSLSPPNDVPRACPATFVDAGVFCYPTGINSWHTQPAGGTSSPGDPSIFSPICDIDCNPAGTPQYYFIQAPTWPTGPNGTKPTLFYQTTGMCERICYK